MLNEIKFPVLIYDNLCTSCTEYAKLVNKFTNGKITMLGHYTPLGKEFKESIFPEGYKGLDMSWFVTPEKAFGGRTGLLKLMKYTFSLRFMKTKQEFPINNFDTTVCTTDCRSAKGVAIRSCSIMTNSKTIKHNT